VTLFDMHERAVPEGRLVRVKLVVAYDGTAFRGFAVNAGVRTVGGTLGAALERVLGHAVHLTCAGRTDAGVHAWGQVVSFDARADVVDVVVLQRAVNAMCGPEIVVREALEAAGDFDARRSAVSRRYRYTVLNRPWPDPFLATTAWHVDHPLDLEALWLTCDPFIGEHDFSAFCRRPRVDGTARPPSLVRRVTDARWSDLGDGVLRFEIEAGSFCHQMVRSLVGTMVEVGRGRRRAGDLGGILRAGDRGRTAGPAPAHGLCLWDVRYP
jgi:tRNA pseudouridine38-40 synthase